MEDRYGKAAWTAVVTPNAVNELRFGWFKDRLSDPGASDLFPAETGATYITVAGSTVGAAQAYPRTYPSENRYQIVENYTWTKGAHSAKFGTDFSDDAGLDESVVQPSRRLQLQQPHKFRQGFQRQHRWRSGATPRYTQTFGNPIQNLRTTDINLYAQDTWKTLQAPDLQLRRALRKDLDSAADVDQSGLSARPA